MVSHYDVNNFVAYVLGQTALMLGCYSDVVLEDRYICVSYNHVVYIRDTESNKDYYLEIDSDPYIYIKDHKIRFETRMFKYYDVLGKIRRNKK